VVGRFRGGGEFPSNGIEVEKKQGGISGKQVRRQPRAGSGTGPESLDKKKKERGTANSMD